MTLICWAGPKMTLIYWATEKDASHGPNLLGYSEKCPNLSGCLARRPHLVGYVGATALIWWAAAQNAGRCPNLSGCVGAAARDWHHLAPLYALRRPNLT